MLHPLRSALVLTLLVALASGSPAQQTAPVQRAAPLRDAGVFHVDTGTWTRKLKSYAALGDEVLYDNTCPTGYFSALSQTTYVDEGRLPSPFAPAPTGCELAYVVGSFTFSYCTDQTAATFGTYTHRFYQDHVTCAPIVGLTPTATIPLNGLPASPSLGSLACWTVTIDLGITGAFALAADGDGDFDGGPSLDRFGWAMSSTAPGTQTGPVIAGTPSSCAHGAGTAFSTTPGPGTGLGNNDAFRITEVPPGSPAYLDACHWFGGIVFAGFDLRLVGIACGGDGPHSTFCLGDGAASACPCSNHSAPGANSGCLNSLGVGATLRALGLPSLSNDTVVLIGGGMPNAPALYFQGTTQSNGGLGTVFGDGLRCAGGSVVRLGTIINSGGASHVPAANEPSISVRGGVTSPGMRTYQIWYRNVAPFCTPSGFNLSNGLQVLWTP